MDRAADDDTALTDTLFDTAPPDEPVSRGLKSRLVDRVSEVILPIVKMAARPYVGGDTIDDALCVAGRLASEGFTTTVGYWDRGRESGREVADICLNAVQAMSGRDSYLSLKPPALRFSERLADEIAAAAAAGNVRVHCDSHGPEVADLSNAMLQAMIGRLAAERLGTTLPGRWKRSLRDADWAIERGLNVRVVKGQWPDPEEPKRNVSAGFLDVIDQLAGRARHVAVATHDFALAREALARLRIAETSCELELLFGMAAKPLTRWARAKGVRTRIYVPFGAGFVPSALRVLKRNPRLVFTVARAQIEAIGQLMESRRSPRA